METSHDFLCFCPFHSNRHTPSMSVSKTKDSFICFNADCGAAGGLVDIVKRTTGRNQYEALRFVMLHRPSQQEEFEKELDKLMAPEVEWREFNPEVLVTLRNHMSEPGNLGRKYLNGRGFSDETIDHFGTGFSQKTLMVAIPVHSPDGVPVGVVGRSVSGKKFKNSVGLPTNKTFFNIHRAKRIGSTVIVTESAFDAMAVHQSGFPNVVGNLGSTMSDYKLALLDKFFDKIIVFADNRKSDPAGRKLGQNLAKHFGASKDVWWANYSDTETYPGELKDASDILEKYDEEHVALTVKNAMPHYEYALGVV